MLRFADVPLGAALWVQTSAHVRYAMGDELDTDVYDYNAGGDDGCPLLMLTPVDESRRMFRRGRGRGYTAGVVQANVGQKHLKSNIFKCFFLRTLPYFHATFHLSDA